MSIVFYTAPMSSATPVAHTLAELEVPHKRVTFDLSKGDQRKADFLSLNPNGKVPTLVVDGTPMFEALAIMQWLGDRYGVQRGLWPAPDSPARLEAMSWSTWAYVTCGPVLQRFLFSTSDRVSKDLHHPAQASHAKNELQELFGLLEGRLANRPCLLGESFTLADLIVASFVTYATYCGISVDGRPKVEKWLERFQRRPAFQQIWSKESS